MGELCNKVCMYVQSAVYLQSAKKNIVTVFHFDKAARLGAL